MNKTSLGFCVATLAACTFAASAFSSELATPRSVPLESHKQVAATAVCKGTRVSSCSALTTSSQCGNAYLVQSNNGTGTQCIWEGNKCANAGAMCTAQ